MPEQFTPDELVSQMTRLGIPREKAERAVGKEKGGRTREDAQPPKTVLTGGGEDRSSAPVPLLPSPRNVLPMRMTLPWSALISENRRFLARGNSIFMTAEYKAARAKVKDIARTLMAVEDSYLPPLEQPLALVARVWFPDNRIHDAPNFAGATHNALKGIVFTDDRWLYDARWLRAGVDVDRPRAEIEITESSPI